jgi:hypothetical protein
MAKIPPITTIQIGIRGLSRAPVGSLLLFASHHRKWRDQSLTDAVVYGAFDGPARFLALSEMLPLPESRFHDRMTLLFDRWASTEALEVCGFEPADKSLYVALELELQHKKPSEANIEAERDKLRRNYERDHAEWIVNHARTKKEAQSRFKKQARAFAVTFQAVQKPTIALILEQIDHAPPGCLVVLDDLTAIRKSATQAGSLKLCGEHARALKDAAINKGILLVAGMQTTEVRDKRGERERTLTLEDFRAYGAPDAAADAVVTAVPVRGDDGWTFAGQILVSRY